MATTVLNHFASCNLKSLHTKRDDGSRVIDALYAACLNTGLLSKGATDDSSRYAAVFDFAIDNHFGCWIIDYVEEASLSAPLWAVHVYALPIACPCRDIHAIAMPCDPSLMHGSISCRSVAIVC